MKRNTNTNTIVAIAILLLPDMVMAQTFASMVGGLVGIINTLVVILASLSLLVFFWGLAVFLFKAGDMSANKMGRDLMLWGILVFFVMSSVWGIVQLIGRSIF